MSIPTEITLDEHLILRAAERHAKSEHIVYKFFPDLRSMQCVVYWGVFSWSIPSENQRWLKNNTTVIVGRYQSTPGDIVRDYLGLYHPTKLRGIREEAQAYENQSSAPLYIIPTTIPDAMYIDVSSTYFSIVKMAGWNVGYLSGKWLTPGRAPLDFPIAQDKAGRNYLVSIGLKTPMLIWTGFRLVQKYAPNVHTNRALWELVQDILHSIASTAVCLGSKYVHTDGYILPRKNAEKLMAVIKMWGLSPRIVAEGPAIICGFGNYMIGDKRTKVFEPSRAWSEPYSNIRETPYNWLLESLKDIRKRGTPERIFMNSIGL